MSSKKNRAVLNAILLAFCFAVFLKCFCFDFIMTEGDSMLPAVSNGSLLFVNRLAFGFRPPFSKRYLARWAQPKSGDLIVFWTPFGEVAVKRCAAVLNDGSFFALGDNAPASFDSRSYGYVNIDNIIGKVCRF
ncbi:MAG: S26 family signal peptidase [Spirochaetaceae bacterium]|jgi:signal peptidase I|nr:S26 family signal peptidase [Spirochaetaceae bacterium]GMO19579.1 MAG: signal peptidase I [Termitinemataceae bacterium]